MINHWEGNEIDVHASGARATDIGSTAKPADGNAFSIDQNQSFFWQQTPQVRYDSAIAANGTVLVNRRAHLLRQIGQQVRCIADAQFLDVSWTIGIHWIWPGLFCGGNVRASDDDTFHFGNTWPLSRTAMFRSDQHARG